MVPGFWLVLGVAQQSDEELLTARIGNLAARTAAALDRHRALDQRALAVDLMSPLAADRAFLCAELRTGDTVLAALPPAQGCSVSVGGSALALPVDAAGRAVLHLAFSDAELLEDRRLEQALAVSAIGLAFLAALIAGAVGFRFLVSRPLRRLTLAIRESAETGAHRPLGWSSGDELGLVVAAFDGLMESQESRERDLSDANRRLRRSEAELSALNQELEARVLARTEELQREKVRAELANESKTRFLRSMSHELRTPLNAIIGFSELIARGTLGRLEHPRYLEFIADIHSSGHHLLRIVNDMLDIARIEVGQEDLHDELVDLDALVADCLRVIRPLAGERGLQLASRAAEPGLVLRVDRTKIKQVLLNLLGNAVKNTPEGGRVELALDRDPAGPDGAGGAVRLRVIDTGRGMTPEQIPLALTAFARLDDDPTLPQKGTGLGLPLARMMVEMHGGSLSIDSTPGQGTSVAVRLPAERTDGRRVLPEQMASAAAL